MIKNELKALYHNKLLFVVLLAIALIPSIYAGLFLASMWDPYGDLASLPVAVVNKDEPVLYGEKELAVGRQLAQSLETNDAMAFCMVDEDTAQTGLANGDYYMVITIPENFSAHAATVMEDEPQPMVLEYATNPGVNYISMKLSESAMKEIKANITEEVTRTYVETVFDSLSALGDGFAQAADGAGALLTGETQLLAGSDTLQSNLTRLAQSTLTFQSGAETLQQGLAQYVAGVKAVDEGVAQVDTGLAQLEAQAVAGAQQLTTGAQTFRTGLTDYTNGVASAQKGAAALAANNAALLTGVDSLYAGTTQLQAGASQILAGMQQMSQFIASTLPEEKQQQLDSAVAGLYSLNDAIAALDAQANDENTGLLASMNALHTAVQTAQQHADTAKTDVTAAYTTLATLLATDTTLTDSQRAAVQSAMDSLLTTDGTAPTGGAAYEMGYAQQVLQGASSALEQQTSSTGGAAQLAGSIRQLHGGASQVLTPSAQAIGSLESGLLAVRSGLDGTDAAQGLIPAMTSVNQGLASLRVGLAGESGLQSGMAAYTNGVASLEQGLVALQANNQALTAGASQLADGSATLASGLDSGVRALRTGVYQLRKGTLQLVGKETDLTSGTAALAQGAAQIADGAGQLADGSQALGEGVAALQEGTDTLQEALAQGAQQVREGSVTDANIDMIAAPVQTQETQITTVANNGHAMAAYMLSVGLWVASLAFCLMYPLTQYTGKLKSGLDWWASKAVVLYPLALLMAGIALLVLHMALGFEPVSMAKTFLVAAVASVCFMAIQYFFDVLLGKVGSFLMLIFMVLQLAGSAGTYPIEISGKLAASIHAFAPFTYSVNAFRSAISGGQSIARELTVLGVIAAVFTALTVVVFAVRCKRIQQGKPTLLHWIEAHGLA